MGFFIMVSEAQNKTMAIIAITLAQIANKHSIKYRSDRKYLMDI